MGATQGRYRFLAAPFRLDDLRGTFAPFFLASLRPIAIACFRLVTFLPDPLLSVPFFRRCIVDFTFFDADLPYFAIVPPCAAVLFPLRFFRAGCDGSTFHFTASPSPFYHTKTCSI
jgi:hypothetical protein